MEREGRAGREGRRGGARGKDRKGGREEGGFQSRRTGKPAVHPASRQVGYHRQAAMVPFMHSQFWSCRITASTHLVEQSCLAEPGQQHGEEALLQRHTLRLRALEDNTTTHNREGSGQAPHNHSHSQSYREGRRGNVRSDLDPRQEIALYVCSTLRLRQPEEEEEDNTTTRTTMWSISIPENTLLLLHVVVLPAAGPWRPSSPSAGISAWPRWCRCESPTPRPHCPSAPGSAAPRAQTQIHIVEGERS